MNVSGVPERNVLESFWNFSIFKVSYGIYPTSFGRKKRFQDVLKKIFESLWKVPERSEEGC